MLTDTSERDGSSLFCFFFFFDDDKHFAHRTVLDVHDPLVHHHRPVVSVTEQVLHIFFQAFSVQCSNHQSFFSFSSNVPSTLFVASIYRGRISRAIQESPNG